MRKMVAVCTLSRVGAPFVTNTDLIYGLCRGKGLLEHPSWKRLYSQPGLLEVPCPAASYAIRSHSCQDIYTRTVEDRSV